MTSSNESSIRTRSEVTGFHHGQMDRRIIAYIGDDPVGHLNYDEFEGVARITWVEAYAGYKRQGVGTALVKALEEKYSDGMVKWTMCTDEGWALRQSIEMRKCAVEADSLEDYLSRYYKSDRVTDTLLATYQEELDHDGYVHTSHHDNITGRHISWYPSREQGGDGE